MDNLINIKITVRSAYLPQHKCNRKLLAFLYSLGYAIEQTVTRHNKLNNRAESEGTWLAVTHQGEGEDIKNLLRQQGFADRDFKINVEYQRGWGFL